MFTNIFAQTENTHSAQTLTLITHYLVRQFSKTYVDLMNIRILIVVLQNMYEWTSKQTH